MKRIMIIGGGPLQVALIRKAKEMGHHVLVTSKETDSPGFAFADEWAAADITDLPLQADLARRFGPDAVIGDQSDRAVTAVAYVCEQLGLPGIGKAMADLFTNKYLMRKFCRSHGYPCPDFMYCENIEDAAGFLKQYGKAVLKPLNCQASLGVYIVDSPAALEKHFAEAKELTRGKTHAVIIEEFLQGTEFTVDGVKTLRGHTTLAISQKRHFQEFPMVASSLLFSRHNPEFDYDQLRDLNDRLVEEMGLPFGLTHAEYIERDGTFYLVEVAARGGGANIASIIAPYLSGVDSYAQYISAALGLQMPPAVCDALESKAAILDFFDFKEGVVDHVEGLETLAGPEILFSSIHLQENDVIGPPSDDTKRAGYYIAGAGTMAELEAVVAHVKRRIAVVYK